jgi:hypothetical protein
VPHFSMADCDIGDYTVPFGTRKHSSISGLLLGILIIGSTWRTSCLRGSWKEVVLQKSTMYAWGTISCIYHLDLDDLHSFFIIVIDFFIYV